ncbi:MAG: S-layer homology domain-containing protein, partial [Clostridia bacterium]|nr:S-layer homology domain-containing protein [Clostridia bacterium]
GKNITRADFTTLIVRAFKFEADIATFRDVDSSKYYAAPIGIAKTLGIVGGINATDFAPNAQITRQDMMVIIYRALNVAGVEINKTQSPTFSDMNSVASYAKDAVEALTGAGLIAGSNGKINPKANTTRAEVAVVLDRILNK